jgi:hypothetical protein
MTVSRRQMIRAGRPLYQGGLSLAKDVAWVRSIVRRVKPVVDRIRIILVP